jgi:hypothetical protein
MTVPCESDVAVVSQTLQPQWWLSEERKWAETELALFGKEPGYAGAALESSECLDVAADALRDEWITNHDAVDEPEPDAAAAYPGYLREYGEGLTVADGPLSSVFSQALELGEGRSWRERVTLAAAVAAARHSQLNAGTIGDVEPSVLAKALWGEGGSPDRTVGSTGQPLHLLDLTMRTSKVGEVREYAVVGAIPVLNQTASSRQEDFAAHVLAGSNGWPKANLEWILLGVSMPAFEPGSSPAEWDRVGARRSGLPPQAIGVPEDASLRAMLLGEGDAPIHDVGKALFSGDGEALASSMPPSWVNAIAAREVARAKARSGLEEAVEETAARAREEAEQARGTDAFEALDQEARLLEAAHSGPKSSTAQEAAAAKTESLLLQARVGGLTQWLESATLGIDEAPQRTLLAAAAPLGAAAAQALVFAHRAAWWRNAVVRGGETPSGIAALAAASLPRPWLPPSVQEGDWHPRGLTEPHPYTPPPQEHNAHYTRTLRARQLQARRMEERPSPRNTDA